MTVNVIDVPMCSFTFGFGLIPYVNEAKLDTSIHFSSSTSPRDHITHSPAVAISFMQV